MPVSLVFGASGAIGRFLVPRLLAAGHDVIAISRTPRSSGDTRVRWLAGDLGGALPALPPIDTIFSLGPLDLFARRLADGGELRSARIVAIGSMSAQSKVASPDPAERALAATLRNAESTLASAAAARGAAWTLLRPTLIYGAGLDRSLTPIARFAMRWRVFPYLAGAGGLRQPVHADDLAAACLAAADSARAANRSYDVGGGERLAFTAMMKRVRASLPVATVPLPVPLALAQAGAGAAWALPPFRGVGAAALRRAREDLVADHSAAAADFGWAPRGFAPGSNAWTPAPLP